MADQAKGRQRAGDSVRFPTEHDHWQWQDN